MVSPALFLRLLQCCFQAVKLPAKVMWDATGGLFQAQLRRRKLFYLIIPCHSFAKVLSAIIMSAESQAYNLRDSLRIGFGKGLCWIFFSSVFMNFLTWFCPVPILCLPWGNMNRSILLASYFQNTCGNSFQGAVRLTCSSKWKSIAAAVLTANWGELKESEVATNWRVRKIWLTLAWKISHNTQQTLLNEAYKYANASVAACLMESFCEHSFHWQRHPHYMSHNQSVLEECTVLQSDGKA